MIFGRGKQVKHWLDAVEQEKIANLRKKIAGAIPVDLIQVKRKRDHTLLVITGHQSISWLEQNQHIALFDPDSIDTTLIEGKIIATSPSKLVLRAEKSLDAKSANYHILEFSHAPYLIMEQNIRLSYQSRREKNLLSKGSIDKSIRLYQGPPGSGKTSAIADKCVKIYRSKNFDKIRERGQHILLSALTHKACENMAIALHQRKIPFVCINVRMDDALKSKYDLDTLAKALENKMKSNKLRHRPNIHEIRSAIIDSSTFLISTAMTAARRFYIEGKKIIAHSFVDEVSQMPLPVLAGVLLISEYAQLYGDPAQLPPVIINRGNFIQTAWENSPLTHTIYHIANHNDIELLDKQRRGRPEMHLLISSLFYDGRVGTGKLIKKLSDQPVIEFINSKSNEQEHRANFRELEICQISLEQLSKLQTPIRVGIISPFRAQVRLLNNHIGSYKNLDIDIGTVHIAQGRTYDYLILSLAASTPSPFLTPSNEYLLDLHSNLPEIHARMIKEAKKIQSMGYEDMRPVIDKVFLNWHRYLQNMDFGENKMMFADLDFDFQDTYHGQNEFATNLINVALSRAKHGIQILGNSEALLDNPLIHLIWLWSRFFNPQSKENTGLEEVKYQLQEIQQPDSILSSRTLEENQPSIFEKYCPSPELYEFEQKLDKLKPKEQIALLQSAILYGNRKKMDKPQLAMYLYKYTLLLERELEQGNPRKVIIALTTIVGKIIDHTLSEVYHEILEYGQEIISGIRYYLLDQAYLLGKYYFEIAFLIQNRIKSSSEAQQYYHKSLSYYLQADNIPENQIMILKISNNLGNIYYMEGDYEMALMQYSRVIDEAYVLDQYAELIRGYNNIGNIHTVRGSHLLASDFYIQALDLARKYDKTTLPTIYGNIGNNYLHMGLIDQAIENYQQYADAEEQDTAYARSKKDILQDLIHMQDMIDNKNLREFVHSLSMYDDNDLNMILEGLPEIN